MFLGEYLHTFDTKNRISLPSKFRKELGRVIIVTRGLDHCLYIYAKKEWEREALKYADRASGDAANRGLARLFLAGSSEADVDGAGRVLIPDHQKEFAQLKKNVVFTGVSDHVEIWDAFRWKSYKARIEKDAERMATKLGEIGAL